MHKKVYIRFVPLSKGGIPENKSWRSCQSDVLVNIDLSKSPRQVLLDLIYLDEPEINKHLSHLRLFREKSYEEKLVRIISMYDMDDGQSYSHGPVDLLSQRIRDQPWMGTSDRYPKLVIVYPINGVNNINAEPISSTDSLPIIWLDVDGVVNVTGNPFEIGINDIRRIDLCYGPHLMDWPVRYSPTIISQLNRLSKIAEIHWMTGWGEKARFRLAPAVGLHDFDVWPHGKGQFEKDMNRPLIWIDDDLDEYGLKNSTESVKAHFKRVLFINTKHGSGSGLTLSDIAKIDDFINMTDIDVDTNTDAYCRNCC